MTPQIIIAVVLALALAALVVKWFITGELDDKLAAFLGTLFGLLLPTLKGKKKDKEDEDE